MCFFSCFISKTPKKAQAMCKTQRVLGKQVRAARSVALLPAVPSPSRSILLLSPVILPTSREVRGLFPCAGVETEAQEGGRLAQHHGLSLGLCQCQGSAV